MNTILEKNEHILKNNSKWTINLNIKPKTIKLLEENAGEYLCILGVGKYFLNTMPICMILKVTN